MIPGEPEFSSKERRLREGIPVPEEIWTKIQKIASDLGLDLNKVLETL